MSEKGQELISDSGYVNLNKTFDRNKDIKSDLKDRDDDWWSNPHLPFYDEETGLFYDADNDGNLLVSDNYADYILGNTEYKDNQKARNFTELVYDNFYVHMYTLSFYNKEIHFRKYNEEMYGGEGFFTYKFKDKYYSNMLYDIEGEKFVLTAQSQEEFDRYMEYISDFKSFFAYTEVYEPGAVVELSWDDLGELYFREDVSGSEEDGFVIEFGKPFA
jgi:hypothetical protein